MQNYFNAITRAQTETQATQALQDWHNDIGGREVGRITRTVMNDGDFADARKGKRKERSDTLDFPTLWFQTTSFSW